MKKEFTVAEPLSYPVAWLTDTRELSGGPGVVFAPVAEHDNVPLLQQPGRVKHISGEVRRYGSEGMTAQDALARVRYPHSLAWSLAAGVQRARGRSRLAARILPSYQPKAKISFLQSPAIVVDADEKLPSVQQTPFRAESAWEDGENVCPDLPRLVDIIGGAVQCVRRGTQAVRDTLYPPHLSKRKRTMQYATNFALLLTLFSASESVHHVMEMRSANQRAEQYLSPPQASEAMSLQELEANSAMAQVAIAAEEAQGSDSRGWLYSAAGACVVTVAAGAADRRMRS